MIKSINTIKNIGYRAVKSAQKFVLRNNIFAIKLPEPLSKDVFELSTKHELPEVLMYDPPIIEGTFDNGIKDPRFKYFSTEYRAYDFEGYNTKFPAKYVCIDSNGDRRLKPHIYLNFVKIKPEYARQGAYSRAIKHLAFISKEQEGCEGRIILNARKIENCNIIPSPSIAHWKCGFRFANDNDNIIMQKVMQGKLPIDEAPEGEMYYAYI